MNVAGVFHTQWYQVIIVISGKLEMFTYVDLSYPSNDLQLQWSLCFHAM